MKKFKEFEINTTWHDNGYATHEIQQIFEGEKPLVNGYTHVIEYSSLDHMSNQYAKLQDKTIDLEAKGKLLCVETGNLMMKNKDLEAKLALAVDALKVILTRDDWSDPTSQRVALKALSKIKSKDDKERV